MAVLGQGFPHEFYGFCLRKLLTDKCQTCQRQIFPAILIMNRLRNNRVNLEQIKTILKKYGLEPNKTFGQNFLVDEIVLQDIIDAANITAKDTVLEIGPGIGNLTEHLIKKAGFVLSVEKDKKFFPILRTISREHKNFRFEIEDILKFNFSEKLKEYPTYKVVANIPYYATGKIIQTLLRAPKPPSEIVLLMQKEVAQNLVAEAGNLSLLGISVQLMAVPSIVFNVPAKSFYPMPKVESSLVKIIVPKKPPFVVADEQNFFSLLRAAFSGKRKQLHNTLKHNLSLSAEEVATVLLRAGLDQKIRPQHLSIPQWLRLAKELDKKL